MKKRLADVVSDDIDVGVYRLQQGDIDRTPFIFKEPLGQTREIKVALSGLFGRLSLAPILNPPEARAASGGGTQAILPRMVSTTRAPARFGPPQAASHRRARGVVDEVSSSPSPDHLTLLSQRLDSQEPDSAIRFIEGRWLLLVHAMLAGALHGLVAFIGKPIPWLIRQRAAAGHRNGVTMVRLHSVAWLPRNQ